MRRKKFITDDIFFNWALSILIVASLGVLIGGTIGWNLRGQKESIHAKFAEIDRRNPVPDMEELSAIAESALNEIKIFYEGMTAIASWYGDREHGRLTASGERFDMNAMTAAHRTYPFGTYVVIENLKNGRRTIAKINDRGPWIKSRMIDVSYAVAKELDMVDDGLAMVRLTMLKRAGD